MELSKLDLPSQIQPVEEFNILDPTKINSFQTCPRQFFYSYVLGWRSELKNKDLVFGSAFHEAMEVMMAAMKAGMFKDEGVPQAAAYAFMERYSEELDIEADHGKKSASFGPPTIQAYWEHYKETDEFKVLHLEQPGQVFIDEDTIITCKIDTICEDERGVFVLEHKTATQQTQVWSAQWLQAIQPKAYNHVLFCMYPHDKVYGTVVNGVFIKKETGFERVTVIDTHEMMEEWLWQMQYKVAQIKHNFEALTECSDADNIMQAFPKNETNCTKWFRECPFMSQCMGWANPLKDCHRVPSGMEVNHWNPITELGLADKEVLGTSLGAE